MIVRTHDLWKNFGRVEALRGLNLWVPEGSAYALIGANGTGKSTTLRILMNILQPSRGSATVLGMDSRRISHRELQKIGYVAESQMLPARLKVEDYFDYLRPMYPDWDRALEQTLRREFSLPADRPIGALSRGMRMKLSLACALAFHPRLLLLDEPLGGLDAVVRDELIGNLLGRADEATVIICSHEIHEIENAVTHVGMMEHGRLVVQESMQDLSQRIRQVRITFDHAATPPADPPRTWLQVQAQGNVLSFVDTQCSPDATDPRITALPGVRRVDMEPMSLRAIFTAYATSARATTVQTEEPA